MKAREVTLDGREWALLEQACAVVPPPRVAPTIGTDADYPDYISNLLLTVLDLQLLNPIVNNAIQHGRRYRWDRREYWAAATGVAEESVIWPGPTAGALRDTRRWSRWSPAAAWLATMINWKVGDIFAVRIVQR